MHFVNRPGKLGRFYSFSVSLLLLIVLTTIGTNHSTANPNETENSASARTPGNSNEAGWLASLTNSFKFLLAEKTAAQTSEPVFEEFDRWLRAYESAGFRAETEQENIGRELAVKRFARLKQLIRTDPQAALENAIPADIYDRLPAFISENSEKRISAQGDFLVYAVEAIDRPNGQITAARTDRFVRFGEKTYEAQVYGRRAAMTTKFDIPLQGIIIGDSILLDENPARRISAAEFAARNIDPAAIADAGIAAEIGGKINYFSSENEFDAFVRRQIEWESKIGPKRRAQTEASAAAPETVWTEGAKTVLVVRVDFSDRPGEPLDHFNQPLTAARAQNLINNEVGPFYANNSYNKTSMTATVTPVLRLPRTQASYALLNPNTLLIEADNAARSAGYDSNNYHLELVAFSYSPGIGWAGIAAIGAQGAMLNGAFYLAETAHELGHNYGLLHANLWRTVDGTPHGAGSNVEYGDCYDNMGACVNGNSTRHFNNRYKRLLDWLTDAEVQTVSGTGTYRIFAQDSPSPGGIRALKIAKNSGKNYWVEFRQLIAGNAQNGALIRWDYASQSYRETQLLDMNPATTTTTDAPLLIGQSFYDAESQIRFTVIGKGNTTPESLDVRVEFGGSTTPTPTPTLTPTPTPTPACSYTLSPTSINVSAGGAISSLGVTAANGSCAWTAISSAPTWINVTGSTSGTGSGTVNFTVQGNPGSARNGSITVGGQIFTVNQDGAATSGRTAFDFDGDGKADPTVYRPAVGAWYSLNSTSGFTGTQFGIATDRIVPADYDGDGRTDIAVYRAGAWYLLRSQAGFTALNFGLPTDIPMPGDFTGDGIAELIVQRPSSGTFYVLNLTNNQFSSFNFGTAGVKLVFGDYDGDRKTDLAFFRDGTWTWTRSSNGTQQSVSFGLATDTPVQADYDGDGKTDVAVFRSGIWYILRSLDGGFSAIQFGLATDAPVPADYDGDRKTDPAVYRGGIWHILQSFDNQYRGTQFGILTDLPIPSAFLQ